MNESIRERYEARASVMKALAHSSRLYIVDELSHGERCVHELTEAIGSDMSTVSKHLGVLRSAGIVCDEKRGSEVYYSLRMGCVVDFFGCMDAVLRGGDGASCGVGSIGRREET
ncbi:MAG: metalloregulator ArsR/SmtB family transcription factor [Candidatus Eisenbacteria bacterium]